MYLPVKQSRNKDDWGSEYSYRVKAARENGGSRQKVAACFGRSDEIESTGVLDWLVEGLACCDRRGTTGVQRAVTGGGTVP